MHWGTDGDTTGLSQLERAFDEHQIDAAILVSFADEFTQEVNDRINELKKEHKIEVMYGDDLYSRLLEIISSSQYEFE